MNVAYHIFCKALISFLAYMWFAHGDSDYLLLAILAAIYDTREDELAGK